MKTEMTKDLKKKVDKYGSVLAAFRSQGGAGKGLMAGGISLFICGAMLGGLLMISNVVGGIVVFGIFIFPGLAMFVPGLVLDKKRQAGYLEYYQKQTGYSLEDLREADRELLSPDAVKIISKTNRSAGKRETVFFITPHYFLSIWPIYGCYLRKLDDIVAAFYSNEIPGINGYRQNLFIITRQDAHSKGRKNEYTGKQYAGFENGQLTDLKNCREICDEALSEMAVRAPHIITSQYIVVKGVKYNLLSMDNWQGDWACILEE